MHPLRRYATDKQEEIIKLLKAFVECESPSDSPEAVNRFVELLADRSRHIAQPKLIRNQSRGHHLRLEFKLPGRKRAVRFLAWAIPTPCGRSARCNTCLSAAQPGVSGGPVCTT